MTFGGSLALCCILLTFISLAQEPTFERRFRIDPQLEHEGMRALPLRNGGYLFAGNLANMTTGDGGIGLAWLNNWSDTVRTVRLTRQGVILRMHDLMPGQQEGWVLCGAVDSAGNTSGAVWWIDSLGNVLQQTRVQRPDAVIELRALQHTLDGDIVAVGYRMDRSPARNYFQAIRLDASGATVWSKSYPVRIGRLHDLVQTPDSLLHCTGYLLDQGDTSGCMAHFVINARGDSLLLKKHPGYGWASGNTLFALPDGLLLAGSTATASITPGDHYFVKTDGSGDTTWTRTAGDPGRNDYITAALLSEDNCLLATGQSGVELELLKYDTSGSAVWSHRFGNTSSAVGQGVALTQLGNYLVAGTFGRGSGLSEYYCLLTDSSGTITPSFVLQPDKPNSLHFFPNPASGLVRFSPAPLRNLRIRDAFGRVLVWIAGPVSECRLDTVVSGWYIIEGENERGAHLQGKLIISE
jgi:hypothetical protein